jgi:hypothetical protein
MGMLCIPVNHERRISYLGSLCALFRSCWEVYTLEEHCTLGCERECITRWLLVTLSVTGLLKYLCRSAIWLTTLYPPGITRATSRAICIG